MEMDRRIGDAKSYELPSEFWTWCLEPETGFTPWAKSESGSTMPECGITKQTLSQTW